MSETASAPSAAPAQRPEFRNLSLFSDIRGYRMPLAGLASIMHRVSGVLIFILLPFIIWLFDVATSSEISFGQFSSAYTAGVGLIPAWFVKLVTLALIWAYLHHFCAGLRYLLMDSRHDLVTKSFGKSSALAVFVVSLALTVILGLKLFGVY